MRTSGPSATLALAALLAGTPARALAPAGAVDVADLDLQALLDPRVGAVSLHEEAASEAPASTFVLTRADLRAHGFRTLAEALRSVPGLWTYSDGFYQYVGFRGVGLLVDYTVRTLVLVDGHPLNDSLGQSENSFGPDLLVPLEMVERIEVVKGPVGSVYGPAAFLGVVNVVTVQPGEERGSGAAFGEAAQGRGTASGAAAFATTRAGGLAVAVGAEGAWTRGYTWTFPELAAATDRPAPPGGRVADADFGDAAKAYARATWRGLTLQAGCGRWYRGLPSAPYSVVIGEPRNHEETENCFGQLAAERALGEHVVLSGRLSHDGFRYRDRLIYEDPGPGSSGDVGPFRDHGTDRWTAGNVQARWTPAAGLLASAGVTVEHHDTVLEAWAEKLPTLLEDPVNGLGNGPVKKSFTTVNGYLLAEWAVARPLTLHAGLTAYRHSLFGGRVTPKAAAVWRPTRGDTLKLVYSEGFRAPSATEAFWDDVLDYIPNLSLRPETVRAGEVAWERRVASGASLFASAFLAEYGDLIRVETIPRPGLDRPPDPADPTDFRQQARNGGAFVVRGAELGARLRLPGATEAYGGLVVQEATGAVPANTAEWTANVAVATRALWRPLRLAARAAFLGERRKDEAALAPGTDPTVGFQWRLDATAALEVPGARGLAVEAGVLNLLDATVLHPVPNDFAPLTEMPEPPRTFRLAVRWQR
jgi:iron complex outermembrane receptor protein